MRPLPDQVVHRPFQAGPYRMAMDLVTVPEADWFEFDQQYLPDMVERRRLLDTEHAAVFVATRVSDTARREALDLVVTAVTSHHPDWFSRDEAVLRNHLTGETWRLTEAAPSEPVRFAEAPPSMTGAAASGHSVDPLELAGRLLQEDLCLIQDSNEGPMFTAAVLCFPSRWRLLDKIGTPLSTVHQPVPFYADRLAKPVDRFMRHLKPGHIAKRLNWSLVDDPTLFQPGGKWRADRDPAITQENAGRRVFLRVERQTLRRLPASGAVLFGIRVHVYPLDQVIDRPDRAAALADAIRSLPTEVQHYKSLLPFREALLRWLGNSGCPPPPESLERDDLE